MTDKTIKVYIQGGCLLDVTNLPPDYNYELIDYDNQQAQIDLGWTEKELIDYDNQEAEESKQ